MKSPMRKYNCAAFEDFVLVKHVNNKQASYIFTAHLKGPLLWLVCMAFMAGLFFTVMHVL